MNAPLTHARLDISADVRRPLAETYAALEAQAPVTAAGYVAALDAVHECKIQRLIVDDNAFGYRIGFAFGPEALDLPLGELLRMVLRRIDMEQRRKLIGHWTFSAGTLTEMIQIKVAINERLAREVEALRAERVPA
jgi:hypothetical protein